MRTKKPRKPSGEDVVILSGMRTPIGKFQGSLRSVPATRLGGIAIEAAIARAAIDPRLVSEVIMGHVVSAGAGQAPARQAALGGGLPSEVGALTVNKVCGSSLKAVMLAAAAIKSGDGKFYVAGGMENMNLAPYLLTEARFGYRLGHGELVDAVIHDGLWCSFENQHMGMAAEWIAENQGVDRFAQDEFACLSHQRAIAATEAGRFRDEIVPVAVQQRKGPPLVLDADEGPRRDTCMDALRVLRPAFKAGGTVTAGNAPGLTDGGAALVLAKRSSADELGLTVLARVTASAQAAVRPLEIFTAPVHAMRKLAMRLDMKPQEFELVELNEAFAAQAVANVRELGLDMGKVNVNGGAIALGHPIGASGARVLVTLLFGLRDRGLNLGAAVLCLGGGEAVALAIEAE